MQFLTSSIGRNSLNTQDPHEKLQPLAIIGRTQKRTYFKGARNALRKKKMPTYETNSYYFTRNVLENGEEKTQQRLGIFSVTKGIFWFPEEEDKRTLKKWS